MYTRGKNMIGIELGYLTIVKELNRKYGRRNFLLKCRKCGAEKAVRHSALTAGDYNVCEHDAL